MPASPIGPASATYPMEIQRISLPRVQAVTPKRGKEGAAPTKSSFSPLPVGIRGQEIYLNGGPFIWKLEAEYHVSSKQLLGLVPNCVFRLAREKGRNKIPKWNGNDCAFDGRDPPQSSLIYFSPLNGANR